MEWKLEVVIVLLGSGVPLFAHLGIEPIQLECAYAVEAPGVTHLRFRVVK